MATVVVVFLARVLKRASMALKSLHSDYRRAVAGPLARKRYKRYARGPFNIVVNAKGTHHGALLIFYNFIYNKPTAHTMTHSAL